MLKCVTELYVYWFRSHIHERRLLLVTSSYLAVHLYQRGLIGQFSMTFGIEDFYEKLSGKFRLI